MQPALPEVVGNSFDGAESAERHLDSAADFHIGFVAITQFDREPTATVEEACRRATDFMLQAFRRTAYSSVLVRLSIPLFIYLNDSTIGNSKYIHCTMAGWM